MRIILRHLILCALLVGCLPVAAKPRSKSKSDDGQPNKALVFFCRASEDIDRFMLRGLDTTFITLPELSWRLALTTGETGIHTNSTTWVDPATQVSIIAQTSSSFELGFHAGYRGIGFGYSWDVLHAHSTNMNISLGSKSVGVEFKRTVSTNLSGKILENGVVDPSGYKPGEAEIANTTLSAWYALNSKHYSHNAAIKQSYIQKKTAGSLLLSVAYMSCQVKNMDSVNSPIDEEILTMVDGVTAMVTRQVAVGLGYGINFTPNRGKVLLHAAANMQLVCYSINHVTYYLANSPTLPGEPQFTLHPSSPVHVTGNMRAAVCWEINRWVHLSAWAQADNFRFESKRGDLSAIKLNNWSWQAHLNIGVRLGAGKKRVREVLGNPIEPALPDESPDAKSKLPKWIRTYFYSSRI